MEVARCAFPFVQCHSCSPLSAPPHFPHAVEAVEAVIILQEIHAVLVRTIVVEEVVAVNVGANMIGVAEQANSKHI